MKRIAAHAPARRSVPPRLLPGANADAALRISTGVQAAPSPRRDDRAAGSHHRRFEAPQRLHLAQSPLAEWLDTQLGRGAATADQLVAVARNIGPEMDCKRAVQLVEHAKLKSKLDPQDRVRVARELVHALQRHFIDGVQRQRVGAAVEAVWQAFDGWVRDSVLIHMLWAAEFDPLDQAAAQRWLARAKTLGVADATLRVNCEMVRATAAHRDTAAWQVYERAKASGVPRNAVTFAILLHCVQKMSAQLRQTLGVGLPSEKASPAPAVTVRLPRTGAEICSDAVPAHARAFLVLLCDVLSEKDGSTSAQALLTPLAQACAKQGLLGPVRLLLRELQAAASLPSSELPVMVHSPALALCALFDALGNTKAYAELEELFLAWVSTMAGGPDGGQLGELVAAAVGSKLGSRRTELEELGVLGAPLDLRPLRTVLRHAVAADVATGGSFAARVIELVSALGLDRQTVWQLYKDYLNAHYVHGIPLDLDAYFQSYYAYCIRFNKADSFSRATFWFALQKALEMRNLRDAYQVVWNSFRLNRPLMQRCSLEYFMRSWRDMGDANVRALVTGSGTGSQRENRRSRPLTVTSELTRSEFLALVDAFLDQPLDAAFVEECLDQYAAYNILPDAALVRRALETALDANDWSSVLRVLEKSILQLEPHGHVAAVVHQRTYLGAARVVLLREALRQLNEWVISSGNVSVNAQGEVVRGEMCRGEKFALVARVVRAMAEHIPTTSELNRAVLAQCVGFLAAAAGDVGGAVSVLSRVSPLTEFCEFLVSETPIQNLDLARALARERPCAAGAPLDDGAGNRDFSHNAPKSVMRAPNAEGEASVNVSSVPDQVARMVDEGKAKEAAALLDSQPADDAWTQILRAENTGQVPPGTVLAAAKASTTPEGLCTCVLARAKAHEPLASVEAAFREFRKCVLAKGRVLATPNVWSLLHAATFAADTPVPHLVQKVWKAAARDDPVLWAENLAQAVPRMHDVLWKDVLEFIITAPALAQPPVARSKAVRHVFDLYVDARSKRNNAHTGVAAPARPSWPVSVYCGHLYALDQPEARVEMARVYKNVLRGLNVRPSRVMLGQLAVTFGSLQQYDEAVLCLKELESCMGSQPQNSRGHDPASRTLLALARQMRSAEVPKTLSREHLAQFEAVAASICGAGGVAGAKLLSAVRINVVFLCARSGLAPEALSRALEASAGLESGRAPRVGTVSKALVQVVQGLCEASAVGNVTDKAAAKRVVAEAERLLFADSDHGQRPSDAAAAVTKAYFALGDGEKAFEVVKAAEERGCANELAHVWPALVEQVALRENRIADALQLAASKRAFCGLGGSRGANAPKTEQLVVPLLHMYSALVKICSKHHALASFAVYSMLRQDIPASALLQLPNTAPLLGQLAQSLFWAAVDDVEEDAPRIKGVFDVEVPKAGAPPPRAWVRARLRELWHDAAAWNVSVGRPFYAFVMGSAALCGDTASLEHVMQQMARAGVAPDGIVLDMVMLGFATGTVRDAHLTNPEQLELAAAWFERLTRVLYEQGQGEAPSVMALNCWMRLWARQGDTERVWRIAQQDMHLCGRRPDAHTIFQLIRAHLASGDTVGINERVLPFAQMHNQCLEARMLGAIVPALGADSLPWVAAAAEHASPADALVLAHAYRVIPNCSQLADEWHSRVVLDRESAAQLAAAVKTAAELRDFAGARAWFDEFATSAVNIDAYNHMLVEAARGGFALAALPGRHLAGVLADIASLRLVPSAVTWRALRVLGARSSSGGDSSVSTTISSKPVEQAASPKALQRLQEYLRGVDSSLHVEDTGCEALVRAEADPLDDLPAPLRDAFVTAVANAVAGHLKNATHIINPRRYDAAYLARLVERGQRWAAVAGECLDRATDGPENHAVALGALLNALAKTGAVDACQVVARACASVPTLRVRAWAAMLEAYSRTNRFDDLWRHWATVVAPGHAALAEQEPAQVPDMGACMAIVLDACGFAHDLARLDAYLDSFIATPALARSLNENHFTSRIEARLLNGGAAEIVSEATSGALEAQMRRALPAGTGILSAKLLAHLLVLVDDVECGGPAAAASANAPPCGPLVQSLVAWISQAQSSIRIVDLGQVILQHRGNVRPGESPTPSAQSLWARYGFSET